MTRTTSNIVKVCRDLGLDLPNGEYTIQRTRAGHAQRSAGAWSWWLRGPGGQEVVGGYEAATTVIRKHRLAEIVLDRGNFGNSLCWQNPNVRQS